MQKRKTTKLLIIILSLVVLSVSLAFSVSAQIPNFSGELQSISSGFASPKMLTYGINVININPLDYYLIYINDTEGIYNLLNDYIVEHENGFNGDIIDFLEYRTQYDTIIQFGSASNFSEFFSNLEQLFEEFDDLNFDISSLETQIDGLETQNILLREQVEQLREQNALSYQQGFNDSLEEQGAFKTGVLSIFSAPFNIFGEVFNFEIFGINFYSVIQVVVTVLLLSFVVKMFL